MGRIRLWIVILLVLGGAALSSVLLLDHYGQAGAASQLCGDSETSGCAQVAASPYSSFQGVPLAGVGLFFYLSVGLLAGLGSLAGSETRGAAAGLAFLATALALVVDVMLLGVQAFVIHAFCRLCIATYLVNIAVILVLLPARSAVGPLWRAVRQGEGRVALAGWALGTLALAAAVLSVNYALGERQTVQQANLLGTPTWTRTTAQPSAPAPAPAESPSPEASEAPAASVTPAPTETPATPKDTAALTEELAKAKAEASRLQGILDDPRKLAQYQADKAIQQYKDEKSQQIDLSKAPVKGPADAPISVVEYSDFLCPYCRQLAGALAGFLPHSEGRIKVYYKSYPLDQECSPNLRATVHPGSCQVALGGICAQQQGRFWPYHDRIFSNPPKDPKASDVVQLAASIGFDADAFKSCMASSATLDRLQADIREGQRLGVNATPTVFIDGKRLPRINDFLQVLEIESKRLGLAPLPPPTQGQ